MSLASFVASLATWVDFLGVTYLNPLVLPHDDPLAFQNQTEASNINQETTVSLLERRPSMIRS